MAVEAKTIFEAISKSSQELLSENGLGLYIPSYQRPYSWDKEKVSRLIEDLSHGMKMLLKSEDSFTFLGTVITIHDTNNTTVQPIVKEDVPSKVLTVIDGQQRMTTLLILCLALHNQIQLVYKSFLKRMKKLEKEQNSLDDNHSKLVAYNWLDGKTQEILHLLAKTFYEKQPYGKMPLYPRMIRSLEDQWSKNDKYIQYNSPIAHLIFNYIIEIEKQDYDISEYKPKIRKEEIEGEQTVIDRYTQLSKLIQNLYQKGGTANELEEVPTIKEMYTSDIFQKSLIGITIEDYLTVFNQNNENDKGNEYKIIFDNLALLVFYANYVLKRVVLTVVKGKNEDYAFTIFESLNTTGEPLTAFETFKPRVINIIGLEHYRESTEKIFMDKTATYLSEFPVGEKLQKATRELLIQFLGAYAGEKVSGRLAQQRSELKSKFEACKTEEQRLEFIKTLSYCADFKKYLWESSDYQNLKDFFGEYQLSSLSKLCLKFLVDLKHTIVTPILTLFFRQIIEASNDEDKKQRFHDFETALKVIVAFSVLWRASRDGTGGIDNEYRELLNKTDDTTGFKPIAITLQASPVIDINLFKQELLSRLTDTHRKGKQSSRETFIENSFSRPIYKTPKIAKLLLLVAHHNYIERNDGSGFLTAGKENSNECLTFEKYIDDSNLSLEHIAPQTPNDYWNKELYVAIDLVHTLGNLTLISHTLNSSLQNRSWEEKRVYYQVLGAKTDVEARNILNEVIEQQGIRENSVELLKAQKFMPNLVALGDYKLSWTKEFIEERSKHLYGLAWDKLIQWLK